MQSPRWAEERGSTPVPGSAGAPLQARCPRGGSGSWSRRVAKAAGGDRGWRRAGRAGLLASPAEFQSLGSFSGHRGVGGQEGGGVIWGVFDRLGVWEGGTWAGSSALKTSPASLLLPWRTARFAPRRENGGRGEEGRGKKKKKICCSPPKLQPLRASPPVSRAGGRLGGQRGARPPAAPPATLAHTAGMRPPGL